MPEVDVVVNEDPDRGQLSSLLTGLEAAGDIESLLVTLVDVPFVSESTVRSVILGYRDTQAPIVRPARGPLHGHPVIFDRAVFDDLRTAPFDAGAKHVIRACQARVLNVPTEDDGAFLDLDTPDDYRGALAR
jgi:molybdenum cofactor cytidylyltransferase